MYKINSASTDNESDKSSRANVIDIVVVEGLIDVTNSYEIRIPEDCYHSQVTRERDRIISRLLR